MRLPPIVQMIGIYLLRVLIFGLFFILCCVPFYIIWDYLDGINLNPGDVTLKVTLAKGLTLALGSMYMLVGAVVGWKLRTHSIYNDILEIDNPVKYAELQAAVRQHGIDKGYIKNE